MIRYRKQNNYNNTQTLSEIKHIWNIIIIYFILGNQI